MPLVLGVDCSTQATKVEVRDADSGALVASGRAPHHPTTPPRSEQDPQQWWAALVEAAAAALANRTVADSVAGVAVAGQQHGLVALDSDRRVLRPAKLWNDTEPAPDAELLVAAGGGPAAWAAACGSVPTAAFTVAKLAWLRRAEPDVFDRLAHVLLPHDWVTAMLTGNLVTDRGDASGTGYWSPAAGGWRTDLLDLVDATRPWEKMLPAVLAPGAPAGTMAPEAARALGLRPGIAVAAGTGDNMAAALRLGMRPGDVALSLGTSGTVYAVAEVPTADPSGAVAGFADATGRFLPLVCTLNATKVTDAVARLLAVDHATLAATALSGDAGAGGVVLVPYLDGERTPNRPAATGTLAGIRSDVTRSQVARAAFEGVACGLLDGLDALRSALAAAGAGAAPAFAGPGSGPGGGADDAPGGRTLLVGGGARSPAYRRVFADLSGRPLEVPDASEHVAAGACVQAAAVLGGSAPEEVAAAWGVGSSVVVEPDGGVDAAGIRAAYAAVRG